MRIGSRVWHVAYGGGVVDTLVAGRRARVRFDGSSGLPRVLPRAELRVEWSPPAADPEPAPPAPRPSRAKARKRAPAPRTGRAAPGVPLAPAWSTHPATAEEIADVRQTIDALRAGVVPSRHVERYTVGREQELAQLSAMLDDRGGLRAVWGDYGAGKTHLLDVAEHLARERGFATARVTLDPLEMPPTHPKRLYRAILDGLRLPGTADVGFGPLAHALCESQDHCRAEGLAFSRVLSPYLHALQSHDDAAIALLCDYVAGEDVDASEVNPMLRRIGWRGPSVLTLSDFRTYGRLYVNLVGTLACWIADAGYQGLVVLFDEVEYVDALPGPELRLALEVLKHFAAVTLPRASLGFDPDDPADLYRGGHEVHRMIPLRFREEQPLAVVFALTPLEEVERSYRRIVSAGQTSLRLRPLRPAHLDQLMLNVELLYQRGYPEFAWAAADRMRAQDRVMAALDDDPSTIRKVVQRTVLVLDEHRYRQWRADGA